jgi:hypothetical protein
MRLLTVLLLAACSKGDTFDTHDTVDTDTGGAGDADTDVDSDTDTDADTDTEGTDADGDGWTVEAGDCDDTSVWVNPAWTEVPDDDLDNDCDGKVDEEFVGVAVLDIETEGGPTVLQNIDNYGDPDDPTPLSRVVYGNAMVEDPEGGYWFTDGAQKAVFHMTATGTVTQLWSDAATEYADGEEPVGYFGLVREADGTLLVSGGDRLFAIDAQGDGTVVETWDCLEGDSGITTICPIDLAIDRPSGQVALPGYFGGFAFWTPDGGLDVKVLDDPAYGTLSYTAIDKRDNGPWLLFGTDLETGTMGVYKYNANNADVELRTEWVFDDFVPFDFAIEQGTGDLYFSANGGWFNTVFRMVADGTYTAMLYPDDVNFIPPPNHTFQPIAIVETRDP